MEDRNFTYDFDTEEKVVGWRMTTRSGKNVSLRNNAGLYLDERGGENVFLEASFQIAEKGTFVLLFDPCHTDNMLKLIEVNIDGAPHQFTWEKSPITYVAQANATGLRYALELDLEKGEHNLELQLVSPIDKPAAEINVTFIPAPAKTQTPKSLDIALEPPAPDISHPPQPPSVDLSDFNSGIGTETIPGRFGFSKGDGLLDCAMPILGIIDKMYVCGHPEYSHPHKWTISVLPSGIDPAKAYHGSFAPAQVGLEADEIEVNHLSVNWKTKFDAQAEFFTREAGEKIDFSCTYSLASAGILVETSDPGFSLSMLEYAGNYQYLLVPGKKALRCFSLSDDYEFDGDMNENWMLLFGATTFPDLPILLVFNQKPRKIQIERLTDGRLSGLNFHLPHGAATMFVATPFGIESSHPNSPGDKDFIFDAYKRCRFWSRAMLSYPIECEEFYKLDEVEEKVEIVQQFNYRIIEDEWRTKPLKTAPLPPILSMLDKSDIVDSDFQIRDFHFPTKYGFLKGAIACDTVSYRLPFMPRARRFPLKDTCDDSISQLLKEQLERYFEFHDKFDTDIQAYPYAGSAMEPYAWVASLFNFMNSEDHSKMVEKCSERLEIACDKNRKYDYPAIIHSEFMREMPAPERVVEIYSDPKLRHINLYNWYSRKEPFTGAEYRICYLNLGLFSSNTITEGTRKEVLGLKISLIENDWGCGLAFYYMYLCAMVSGNFKPLRENWSLIRDAYSYFEKLHDWACMGSAYCDNGVAWIEGANYGAYTSFINMAEAIENNNSYQKGVYMAAKQMALRFAIFKSSQSYFHRFFNHKPWFITKLLHEEANPANRFLCVPELQNDCYRYGGLYNLTTEGLFPELLTALNDYFPEDMKTLCALAMKCHSDNKKGVFDWTAVQESCSCLITRALDIDYNAELFMNDLADVENRNQLIKEWRGIHIFSRLLPKNYFKCQLLAWVEAREHPLWLEFWSNVEVIQAEYDSRKKIGVVECKLTADDGVMRFGIRRIPKAVVFNGESFDSWRARGSQLELNLAGDGIFEIDMS